MKLRGLSKAHFLFCFHEIRIVTSVSRHCNEDGTWNKADYTGCLQHLVSKLYNTPCLKINKTISVNETHSVTKEDVKCEDISVEQKNEALQLIPMWFLTGYTISLMPVSLAVIIFLGIR